jgi:hypothetical protein
MYIRNSGFASDDTHLSPSDITESQVTDAPSCYIFACRIPLLLAALPAWLEVAFTAAVRSASRCRLFARNCAFSFVLLFFFGLVLHHVPIIFRFSSM